jgi:hypothetical protein
MRTARQYPTWHSMLFSLIAFSLLVVVSEDAHAGTSITGLLAQPSSTGTVQQEKPIDKTKIYKGVGIAAGVLVVVFVMFFVVYPNVLKRGNVWPVSLYGRCACIAWILSWTIALLVLWADLPIAPFDTFWKQQGLRAAFIAVGLIFGFTWLFYWRSEPQKK